MTLRGEPGTRAPHLLLRRSTSYVSTIDLGGSKWSLWVGTQGNDWIEAVRHVAQDTGLLLAVYSIGTKDGWEDIDDCFEECYGVGTAGAVLVRPDGFVAWRSVDCVKYPQELLSQVIISILGR